MRTANQGGEGEGAVATLHTAPIPNFATIPNVDLMEGSRFWYTVGTMLKGDDIKRLVKKAENGRVEFKLAKGGVPDTLWEPYSAFGRTFVTVVD